MRLAESLLAEIRSAARPVVLIDGGSGSGKTTLAPLIAERLGAQLVHLDDFYPGWDGLEGGSRHVHDFVLSSEPRWQRWDWVADRPAEWHVLDQSRPLVIEGSGSLSRANRAIATFGIWVELDAATRKHRALARDGDAYALHWDRWAAQEAAFAAREHPRELADYVVFDD
ncbi:ATP-binding protein [Lacisediminihabitans changchengi]|uniref:ATP-binding protein n=1 Tax=Lacisediminihabitans changchengi TaxID=2787634 RepID=UPI0027DD0759|nr:ATP-binding protein [Lacisediminihabitans changchengi]